MKRELQEKLFNDFPLLYGDKNKPVSQSSMAFGFEFSEGWYDLVYELSAKLEKLIEQFIKESPDLPCRVCYCAKDKHDLHLYNPGKCLSVLKRQTKWIYVRMWKPYFLCKWVNRIKCKLNTLLGLFFYEFRVCHCEKYEAHYPRASQVKEKFGSLRFHMTVGTDEMYDLIDEAENKSCSICEECGGLGRQVDLGWIFTLCEDCEQKRKNR